MRQRFRNVGMKRWDYEWNENLRIRGLTNVTLEICCQIGIWGITCLNELLIFVQIVAGDVETAPIDCK